MESHDKQLGQIINYHAAGIAPEEEQARKNMMTLEQALEEIRTKPVVPLWPHIGLVLGLSRGGVYEAAKRGEIDVMEVGRLKKAVTAPLRRKLGIDAA
jgi:hypothetical protein